MRPFRRPARARLLLAGFATVALLATACAGGEAEPAATEGEEESEEPEPETTTEGEVDEDAESGAALEEGNEDGEGERTFTDAEGVTVSFDEPISRVVCLTGPCVDILAELDVEPAGILGPALVTDERYFGEQGEEIPVLEGSFDDPDLESLAAMEPDLVIGLTGFQSQNRDRYESVAPFVALGATTVDSVYENLRGIAELVDRGPAAEEAIEATEQRLAAYADEAPGDARVLHMVGFGSDFTVSVQGSLYGGVLDQLFDYPWDAPVNEDDPTGLVPFSLEEILAEDPEWLFVADLDAGFGGDPWTDQFDDNPVWNELTAVQEDQVELVDTGAWINYRGTRALRLVVEEAAMLVHPDVFPEPLD